VERRLESGEQIVRWMAQGIRDAAGVRRSFGAKRCVALPHRRR
jgi:hypothetical protein